MIGVSRIVHAPFQSGFEVALQMDRPALKRVIAMGRALPSVFLVRPEVRAVLVLLIAPISAGPAAPGRVLRVAHAGGYKVEEGHRVAFLLGMGRVGRVEGTQWAVAGQDVAFEVKSPAVAVRAEKR